MDRDRKFPRRRRHSRSLLPEIQPLEDRRLLSISLSTLSQAPVTAGISTGQINLASFSFTTGSATDYSATLSWGDGTTSAATIVPRAAGQATILGTHIYATYATDTVGVSVTGPGGTASGNTSIQVLDAAISASGLHITPSWNMPFSGNIASFTDLAPGVTASSFAASINWGNNHTSTGTITAGSNGLFTVSGSNTYSSGSYVLGVSISDAGGTSATASMTIVSGGYYSETSPALPLSALTSTVNAVPGQSFSGAVATFSGGNSTSASNYSATIKWGDGYTSAGTISANQGGQLQVTGTHVYASSGILPLSVVVTENDGNVATAGGTATVAPPILTATGVNIAPTEGNPFSGTVVVVGDADPTALVGDLSATVNWGDGITTYGLMAVDPTSGFDVIGNHAYASPGNYAISVQAADRNGHTVTGTTTANVADALLTSYGSILTGGEGASISGTLASFF